MDQEWKGIEGMVALLKPFPLISQDNLLVVMMMRARPAIAAEIVIPTSPEGRHFDAGRSSDRPVTTHGTRSP